MGHHSVVRLEGDSPRVDAAAIRILIIDDSIVARTIFRKMLEDDRRFVVVDAVANASHALKVVRSEQVDIILLDLEMPEIAGIDLLPKLLTEGRGAHVIIVSSAAAAGAVVTIEALALGATEALQKPEAGRLVGEFADTLRETISRIATEVRATKRSPDIKASAPPIPVKGPPVECLAIGASTGGIHAITEFLKGLPEHFDVPMLITQHLPAVFMSHFAQQLTDISGRHAIVARDGDRLERGRILIAPGEGHIRVVKAIDGARVTLDPTPAISRCMPSVDPMFESVAACFGDRAIAVVLSGMGRDGTIGAKAMAATGAEILAQNPETCVVWGMPGSIAQAGLATAVLSPEGLAQRVAARMGRRS